MLAAPQAKAFPFDDDGVFPNHAYLPLLYYPQALRLEAGAAEPVIQHLYAANRWEGSWVNGVYDYHHYHSTAHEVLAVSVGQAELQFGGPRGLRVAARTGDVVVVPAGVAHKRLHASGGFTVVGAYPRGQRYDICFGRADERPAADRRIAAVPLPERDPLFGLRGPLMQHWRAAAGQNSGN
jgi:uncharacterized protein YjlB